MATTRTIMQLRERRVLCLKAAWPTSHAARRTANTQWRKVMPMQQTRTTKHTKCAGLALNRKTTWTRRTEKSSKELADHWTDGKRMVQARRAHKSGSLCLIAPGCTTNVCGRALDGPTIHGAPDHCNVRMRRQNQDLDDPNPLKLNSMMSAAAA